MISSGAAPAGRHASTVSPFLALMMLPLPLLPLQITLSLVLRRICARHPHIFDRLGVHARKRFGITPTDLPFSFVLEPRPANPRFLVVRDLPSTLDVRISSSLASLFGLAEGSLDGDALMFSRDLLVEGDVEAILALRNAIDDAQLDLILEIAGAFGPLGVPLKNIMQMTRTLSRPLALRRTRGRSWN